MGIQIKLIVCIIVIAITGCASIKQAPEEKAEKMAYSNNFSTLEIRSLWHVCSLSFFERNPYTPKEVMVTHCDCYTDYIRKVHKDRAELNSFTKEEGRELTKNLVIECNSKLKEDQKYIDPASI
jgi:hypothetical protein